MSTEERSTTTENAEDARTGVSAAALRRALLHHLAYSQAKDHHSATPYDRYVALALAVRDRLIRRWIRTQQEYYHQDVKRVYYLSAEFLMGRALEANLLNVGLLGPFRKVLAQLGWELADLFELEPDAGLGNGGLGRLAACFLDSMATLGYAGYGYGLRYEFGIFDQEIRDGEQIEHPDEWLRLENIWEIRRPEYVLPVQFYGRTETYVDARGRSRVRWVGTRDVLGMPYDTPVAGYGNQTVNNLRLWRARASKDFDLRVFNEGDYERAVQEKNDSENISKVLYPRDHTDEGKELRLKQQYFFVSCSVQDIVHRFHKIHGDDFSLFPDKVAIQLNDTHPTVAIPELMRILLDEHGVPFDRAWEITQRTFAYTNHTLLSEALERWPVDLFARLLPRHLQIIFEINQRFLGRVRAAFPDDPARVERMSIIQEHPVRMVRMANLATVGSHSINGVAALHSELVRQELLRDFFEMFPERFNNKTNGVTPRRWLLQCNPRLADLISERIGRRWPSRLDDLSQLAALADDAGFRADVRRVKRENKAELAAYVREHQGIELDVDSMFDVQVKRIHEYKRQHLNVLHVVHRYLAIKKNPMQEVVPRTVIFGGKAAPGYFMAKLVIRLINGVADVINADPDVRGRLKVVFLENFRVSLAERVFPASDLSEQISTAGKEASGTGNMKFALNGALTIGTLDGANVEIREEVGAENFFLFGLTVSQVAEQRARGYAPRKFYDSDVELRSVLDAIASGAFSRNEPDRFRPLVDSLLDTDPYMLCADFRAYVDCQSQVDAAYRDSDRWVKMAVLNIARMGKFSSDRTIREYAEQIWGVEPIDVGSR